MLQHIHAVHNQRRRQYAAGMLRSLAPAGRTVPVVGHGIALDPDGKLGGGSFGEAWRGWRDRGDGYGSDVVVKLSTLLVPDNAKATRGNVAAYLMEVVAQRIIRGLPIASTELCAEVVACAVDQFVTPDMRGAIVFSFETSMTLAAFVADIDSWFASSPPRGQQYSGAAAAGPSKTVPEASLTLMYIVQDLLRDVARLHAAGLGHLDLKPENVLVSLSPGVGPAGGAELGHTLIIDMGLACANETLLTANKAGMLQLKKELIDTAPKKPAADRQTLQLAFGMADPIASLACDIRRGTLAYMNANLLGKQDFRSAQLEDLHAVGIMAYELGRGQLLSDMPDLRDTPWNEIGAGVRQLLVGDGAMAAWNRGVSQDTGRALRDICLALVANVPAADPAQLTREAAGIANAAVAQLEKTVKKYAAQS